MGLTAFVFAATAGVTADEVGDPRWGRIALFLEYSPGDSNAESLLDAAATALTTVSEVFWFELDAFDLDEARHVQAEVLGRLSIEQAGANESRPGQETYALRLQFFRVPHYRSHGPTLIPSSDTVLSVDLDRGGRYQRIATWQPFVDAAVSIAAVARPVATVTIESDVPVTLDGLPPWITAEVPGEANTRYELELRTLRQYEIVAKAPGHRPERVSFYLEYDPFTITLEPRKYPRHTVGFISRGVSWPGLEYAWYDAGTRWSVYAGITTFAWGLTPLQQMGTAPKGDERPERDAQIISSMPLHELEVGYGRFLLDRERSGRALVSVAGVVRVTNLDDQWSLEPITPTAVRLGFGWEQELPWRLVLTQRVATDVYWPVRAEFLRNPPWTYHLGPILWQLPIYRVGLRVVL